MTQPAATTTPAVLVLEDGQVYAGKAYGAQGETFGEAVFATGMTGYQETITDPSYCGQVVVQTAPHIGNTGWNDEDDESTQIWVAVMWSATQPAEFPTGEPTAVLMKNFLHKMSSASAGLILAH